MGLGEEGDVIKKYRLAATKSHRNVKHSIGDIVTNIVINMFGARWILDLWG